MPKHRRHGHDRSHEKVDSRSSKFVWEWFWACCNCKAHASMSTFIEICPGCSHTRCADCPMEAVKISASQIVQPRPEPTLSTSQAVPLAESSPSSVPSRTGQVVSLDWSSSASSKQNVPSSTSPQNLGSAITGPHISQEHNSCKRHRELSSANSRNKGEGSLDGDLAKASGDNLANPPLEPAQENSPKKGFRDLSKYLSFSIKPAGAEPISAKLSSTALKVFACPYHKWDPRKYGPWTDKKFKHCPSSRITELHNIKHHLKEAHTQAPVSSDPSRIVSHTNEGIQEDQWEQINRVFSQKGKKRVDDDARWYEIWRIIFPGVPIPTSTRMERPGYIARTSYGIDELRLEFEYRIEADLQNGNLQRDGQIQRLLHHFEQTLEACSAALGSMQLASPGDGREGQRSISDPVQSKHKDIEDIFLTHENDAGHLSSTSRRTLRPQGAQDRIKESSLEDYAQPTSLSWSSETPLAENKDQSLGIDDFLPEIALSPFYGDDFDSDAAYYLAQSAWSQTTPHPEDDSYGQPN